MGEHPRLECRFFICKLSFLPTKYFFARRLYNERATVFQAFGYGLVLTIGSVVMCVWLHLHWEASLVCCAISVFTISRMRDTYYRIVKKFDFDDSLTVDFQDIFDGPAAIQAVPMTMWRSVNGLGSRVGNGVKGSFDSHNKRNSQGDDESLVRRSPNKLEMV